MKKQSLMKGVSGSGGGGELVLAKLPAKTDIAAGERLPEFPWWSELSVTEQTILRKHTQAVGMEMLAQTQSKLLIGEHLKAIQAVLEPRRVFTKFLLAYFRMSTKTAYRYIKGYENAQKHLPAPVLKIATVRGYNLIGDTNDRPLGVYTDVVKRNPPPKTENEQEISAWLENVENKKRVRLRAEILPSDPETLLRESYRFVASRYRRLPQNSRQRAHWIEKLVGMVLTDLGVGNARSFSPIAVPEDWRTKASVA